MIKEKREIYHKLISLLNGYGLCNICRYARWEGNCKEAELDCCCGIDNIEDKSWDKWQGDDCWAFRPRWLLEDTVDMVGILLQGKYPDMSACKQSIPKKMKCI